MRRWAIVGSRGYCDEAGVRAFVRFLAEQPDLEIVSGGARGVDGWAADEARKCGLNVTEYPADWSKGKGAGFARNRTIVDNSDVVVAFWDGESRGTQNTIELARKAGKLTIVKERKS